jgi:DNA-binding SARP family transcriptional activator
MKIIDVDARESPIVHEDPETDVLFHVLGPLEVRHRDGRPVPIGQRKKRRLLSLLLLHAGSWMSPEDICGALWDDDPPRSAAGNIKTYVSELRHLLPDAHAGRRRIESRLGRYRIAVQPGEVDVSSFEAAARRGRDALRDGAAASAARHLEQALELWRGRPFDELPADVARAQTAHLEEEHWAVWENLIDARLALGQHDAILPMLRALTIEHPLRERFWGQLLVTLDRSGRRAEALDAYHRVYRLLVDQLGIVPCGELQRLHQQVLAGDGEEAGRGADLRRGADPRRSVAGAGVRSPNPEASGGWTANEPSLNRSVAR